MRAHRLLALALVAGPALATGTTTGLATGGLPTTDLTSAAIRMVLGLAAVLALLGATAWVSRRFRAAAQARGGQIEVVSGLSLGTRDRVVLIRVGGDQVLVGISPSGMRALHVLGHDQDQPPSKEFTSYMEKKS